MPLTGGSSDKFGNRYEGKWTVFWMAEVLEERADSIRLEPPGAEGEGAEFWVNKDGRRYYHQVKRQEGARGHWTLNGLGGIVGKARGRLIVKKNSDNLLVPGTLPPRLAQLPAICRKKGSDPPKTRGDCDNNLTQIGLSRLEASEWGMVVVFGELAAIVNHIAARSSLKRIGLGTVLQ